MLTFIYFLNDRGWWDLRLFESKNKKASLQGFAHQQLITESGEASIGVSRLLQPAWGGGAGVFMGQPGHIFPAGGAWIIRTPALETQPTSDENLWRCLV